VAGDTQEVWRMLTGSPTGVFKVVDYVNRPDDLFALLKDSFDKNFLHMGHLSFPYFGLEEGHAYSLLGVYELFDDQKAVAYRLISIANPHGVDGTFNGSFHDNDPRWTEEFRRQVPNFTIANDGKFYMELSEFI